MNQRRFQFRPLLEAFEDRICPSSTAILPISDFLSHQGTSHLLTSPVPDQFAWQNSTNDPGATSSDPNRLIMVDYTGQAASYLLQHGINLHTKITGLVTETPIGASGLMEVSVNLEATNALTWVTELNPGDSDTPAINTDPLELGYRPWDLIANPSLKPALSDVHFQITFQLQAGAPLPDLFQALVAGSIPGNTPPPPPPGFAPETLNFESWGTGTLDQGTTVGTPGQTAIVSTTQIADLTSSSLPGTLPDGFWQEPIDILPVATATTHVAYQNGTLDVNDVADGNDNVRVSPAANGGATVSSNLGNGTFPAVSRLIVTLGSGNNNVQIGNLPAATVDVAALDGNNNITVGNTAKLAIHVGGGNNHISTGNTSPGAQVIGVGGSGNNHLDVDSANAAEILVAGNGNNDVSAEGDSDFLEVLGNGNNHLVDTGTNDLIWLGGDGNNDVDNQGAGSMTVILAGTGHNHGCGH